jgi:hypothetical protein
MFKQQIRKVELINIDGDRAVESSKEYKVGEMQNFSGFFFSFIYIWLDRA